MTIGEKIQEVRIEYGYSLGDLSGAANLNVDILNAIESGIKKPSKSVLRRIAEALDVSPAALS